MWVLTQVHASADRDRRSILGSIFGTNEAVIPAREPQIINHQVQHYPVWKVHKYNGINLKPMPISVVPKSESPVPTIVQEEVVIPKAFPPSSLLPVEHKVVPVSFSSNNPVLSDDVQNLMKLLGVSDASQVPSVQEVMDMLGASTQEEAIETVKEIASTEEGIELIKSFIEARQNPIEEEEEVIVEPVAKVVVDPPTAPSSWSPTVSTVAAYSGIPNTLDRTHTNAQLLQRIVPADQGGFRGAWRNLRQFFTIQDNTRVPLSQYSQSIPEQSSVIHVNHPIPAASIDLPKLPKLDPIPRLKNLPSYPNIPPLPIIKLPSHFNVPKAALQGPYTRVKYPVNNIRSGPLFQRIPVYQQYNQPLIRQSQLPPASSLQPLVRTSVHSSSPQFQINYSQSNFDAFQNAPKIVSSLPVPKLPYNFEETAEPGPALDDDQYFVAAANSPVQTIAIPPPEIEDEIVTKISPSSSSSQKYGTRYQRLSGFNAFATGKVHRAANMDILQIPLTAGNTADQSIGELKYLLP